MVAWVSTGSAADYICCRPIYSAHGSVNRVRYPPPMMGIIRKFPNAFRHGLRNLRTWKGPGKGGTQEDPKGWRRKVRIDLRVLISREGVALRLGV